MLTVNAASGFGSVVGETYQANAVRFDGTNDYLNRGGDLDTDTDNYSMIISFWINFTGGDGTLQYIYNTYGNNAGGMWITKETTNKLKFYFKFWTGGVGCDLVSTSTFTASTGWTHILFEWYGAYNTDEGWGRLWVDDVEDSPAFTNNHAGLIQTNHPDHTFGADTSGNNKLDAEVSSFILQRNYWNTDTESVRRRYISGSGKPVDPTKVEDVGGADILIGFWGETATWQDNHGTTYGGFTENGALTDAASSPSD